MGKAKKIKTKTGQGYVEKNMNRTIDVLTFGVFHPLFAARKNRKNRVSVTKVSELAWEARRFNTDATTLGAMTA